MGSLRAIEVKRSGETVARFDTYDLLLRGDARDVQLRDGDVVFVPTLARLGGFPAPCAALGSLSWWRGRRWRPSWPWRAAPRLGAGGKRILLERERPDGGPEIIPARPGSAG